MSVFRFKYKKSIPLSYDRQGLVYFTSKCYKYLPVNRRRKIDRLIREVGREYADALRAFVIQGESYNQIEMKYYCSASTLYRIVRDYYQRFPVE